MRSLQPDKACGPDGVSRGIFSLLPAHSIMIIATLFNQIFSDNEYPTSWARAKMFTVYKKGHREDPNNYGGIIVTKLYDIVICRRLHDWLKPCREQAGAQWKRGCLEHIASAYNNFVHDHCFSKKEKGNINFM